MFWPGFVPQIPSHQLVLLSFSFLIPFTWCPVSAVMAWSGSQVEDSPTRTHHLNLSYQVVSASTYVERVCSRSCRGIPRIPRERKSFGHTLEAWRRRAPHKTSTAHEAQRKRAPHNMGITQHILLSPFQHDHAVLYSVRHHDNV